MIVIDKRKVPVKYLTEMYGTNPTELDLLWEIVKFLDAEGKDEFTDTEIKSKTRSRIGELDSNIQVLIDQGYIEKKKASRYLLVTHPWM